MPYKPKTYSTLKCFRNAVQVQLCLHFSKYHDSGWLQPAYSFSCFQRPCRLSRYLFLLLYRWQLTLALPLLLLLCLVWWELCLAIITTSGRIKCVPQILGLSSIHIFRLLFLPLSITFRRIHERNSFDLGAICLFCFKFLLLDWLFNPHCYLMSIKFIHLKY